MEVVLAEDHQHVDQLTAAAGGVGLVGRLVRRPREAGAVEGAVVVVEESGQPGGTGVLTGRCRRPGAGARVDERDVHRDALAFEGGAAAGLERRQHVGRGIAREVVGQHRLRRSGPCR